MKSLLLFLILGVLLPTMTPAQAVIELSGKHCSHEGVCCKNEETCCATGCCPQATFCCPKVPGCCKYPHCCPKGSKTGCCPTNASVCCPKQGGCCTESFPVCGESKCHKAEATSAEEFIEMFFDTTTLTTTIDITATTTVEKQPFIDFPVFTSLPGPCNTLDVEIINEGNYSCMYKDPKNIPTIGIGFNLIKPGAKEQIEGVGADYNAVLNGSQCLNATQILTLFKEDMNTAVSCGSSWLKRWSSLSVASQSAIADMAFNMGCTKLANFICLRSALDRSPPDLQWAVQEMRNSTWCGQVKKLRCDRDVQCMLQGLKKE